MMSGMMVMGLALALQSTPDTMPPNSWLSVPNTKMQAVAPANGQFPGTWAIVGPSSVIMAWCGAALDTRRNRLVLWGGGHADYYGNELYTFDVPALQWERLTDPFINPVMDQEVNADGTPNSRHTYGGLAYIAHADRFFGEAGSLAGIGFAPCFRTWTFDFVAKQWTDRNPAGGTAGGGFGASSSYDPASRKVWFSSGTTSGSGGVWSYDYDQNKWTQHNPDDLYEYTSTIDTRRGLLVLVGNGQVLAYDIKNANYTQQVWSTTGGGPLIGRSAPGIDYDPTTDRIVGWHGGSVHALDPATKAWTAYNPPGAPATTSNGIYGRWRYVPSVNAFILVTDWAENVHFFKFSAGAGTTPPPAGDTTAPTVTISAPAPGPAPSNPVTVTGTAADANGVATVTWANAATGGSGTAAGTTSWAADIPLNAGPNLITITAYDPSGNAGTATITVDGTGSGGGVQPPPPSGREGRNGDHTINDSLCGLLGAEPFLLWLAAVLRRRRTS